MSIHPGPPRFEILIPRFLVGKRMRMSLAADRTYELWSSFMPLRRHVSGIIESGLWSVDRYAPDMDFRHFGPETEFEKWAAVEADPAAELPEGLESLMLEGGLYAVFIHRGSPADAEKTYRYIFEQWIPSSGYIPDQRCHFALMGEKYNPASPDSEEEVWIPVRAETGDER
jgi:AraC family transcriptional regulator